MSWLKLKSTDGLAAFGAGLLAFILLVCSFYGTDAEVYLFPRIAAVCVAILAAILLFDVLKNNPPNAARAGQQLIDWRSLLPGLMVGVVYILVIEKVGFYASSLLAFMGITMLYGQRKTFDIQAIIYKLIVATLFMAVLYALFWKLLHVRTPTGLLM